MKSFFCLASIFFVLIMSVSPVLPSESIDELLEQYGRQYEELVPAPNSSINDDYKMGQTALGVFYTNQILNLIYCLLVKAKVSLEESKEESSSKPRRKQKKVTNRGSQHLLL